ncbi:hypothetical protein EIP91_007978 [Steccherinum ochraceum]|uniref:N-alpha-acetyltransferase 40 n=1 Tax=Steccherinum ochraceum TaxID=92696 RepID=A0A4R0R3M1_9APHY|nr:hypothetical protein EIP91_007978 [Steccherinum ochraceum]
MPRRRLSDKIRQARAVEWGILLDTQYTVNTYATCAQATAEQLAESILPSVVIRGQQFVFRAVYASQLSNDERDLIWNLTEGNMADMSAASSMGWASGPKKRELFHAQSRFIVAYNAIGFVGFTMFRFDVEDDGDVLYCYEAQIEEGMRGLGVGKQLLEFLVPIGKRWGMDCIMLTVLKVNAGASRFYKANGFKLDEYSPDEPECDYEILSMPLKQ